MKIYDFHVHCFPDSLAQRATARVFELGGTPPVEDGTANGILRLNKRCGITSSLIVPIATKPEQAEHLNIWAASLLERGLYAFGSVNPRDPDPAKTVAQIKALGLYGIKMHPEYQDFSIDDPSVFPIYEQAVKHKLPILFHAGWDIAYPPPYRATPPLLKKVLEAFPDLTVIAAHLGGTKMTREATELLADTRIFVDTAAIQISIDKPEMLRTIRAFGADKVFFGSDAPWFDPAIAIDMIKTCGLTESEQELIFHKNFEKFFNITEG